MSGAAQFVQQVNVGGISGSNNTVNVHQSQVPSIEDLARLVRAAVPDANAEIDLAVERLKAGDTDIAIHMLEELRRKRWDTLSAREKYRTAANMGHALERKGELRKSAKYYLEAKEHQPLDEKARAMEAIAFYHLDQKEKAYELAGDVLKDHSNCAIALSVRIRSAPPEVLLDALEASVPAAVAAEFDILHALVWRAVATGDSATANRIIDIALKHHPDAAEAKEQLAVVIVHEEGSANLAKRQVNKARVELAVETLTARIAKHRGQPHEAHLRQTRAEAYDILGNTEAAISDYRTACEVDKENTDLARRFVLLLERHDRYEAAIDVLRQSDKVKKDHRNRLILAGLLSDSKNGGGVESSISLLRETIAEKPEPEMRTCMVGLLAQLLSGQKKHDEAIAFLDGLETSYLSPAMMSAIRSRTVLAAGKTEEALASALQAVQSLVADSPVTERLRVAETLYAVGEKQEALKQLKQFLKPDHIDHFVSMALELARETGDDEFIMSFCKQLRTARAMSPHALELEVVTLEKYRIFDKAIDVMNGYLADNPDGELAKVFRLRLTLLGIRLDKPELIESDPAKLPPVDSKPVMVGAATANALRHGPHPERGIEYAYDLVRRNFNDHTARGVYVAIIGLGDDAHHFPDVSAIAPGCAVKYKPDDSNDEKWMIVEDAVNPDPGREEYGPDHIWVKELIGQIPGGRFHLRRDEIQPRLATITGIVNKYVYRKFEIINGWEDRFPDEGKFFVRKYTMPTNPDGSPDFSPILKALDLREKQIEEMHELYRAHPISATTFARISDAGLLESLNHLASEGNLPIRCCLGNAVELKRAEESLSGAEQFVLDPTALATLFFSNQYEQLRLMPGKIVLCESALDEYAEMRQKFSGASHGFMGKIKGKYFFREDTPPERERLEKRFDTFLTKIKSLVTLKTSESFAKLAPEAREELVGLFGESTAHAMAEAAGSGAVLWTDDLGVAEFGREKTGIAKRVWTQLVFRSVAPPDVLHEMGLFLLHWRYYFTRLEPEVVLAACRGASWDADAPGIKCAADWLNLPELMDDGSVHVCAQSLKLIWQHGPDIGKKQQIAKRLLQAVRRRKTGRQAIARILRSLGMIFVGDKAAQKECEIAIDDMQKAELTQGEIAASKAAWSKVLKQFKGNLPDTSIDGQATSTPKQRAAKRKADRKRKKR